MKPSPVFIKNLQDAINDGTRIRRSGWSRRSCLWVSIGARRLKFCMNCGKNITNTTNNVKYCRDCINNEKKNLSKVKWECFI